MSSKIVKSFNNFSDRLSILFVNTLTCSLFFKLVCTLVHLPVGEGVDAFPNTFRVDIALADQTLSSFDHSFDPMQV